MVSMERFFWFIALVHRIVPMTMPRIARGYRGRPMRLLGKRRPRRASRGRGMPAKRGGGVPVLPGASVVAPRRALSPSTGGGVEGPGDEGLVTRGWSTRGRLRRGRSDALRCRPLWPEAGPGAKSGDDGGDRPEPTTAWRRFMSSGMGRTVPPPGMLGVTLMASHAEDRIEYVSSGDDADQAALLRDRVDLRLGAEHFLGQVDDTLGRRDR